MSRSRALLAGTAIASEGRMLKPQNWIDSGDRKNSRKSKCGTKRIMRQDHPILWEVLQQVMQ